MFWFKKLKSEFYITSVAVLFSVTRCVVSLITGCVLQTMIVKVFFTFSGSWNLMVILYIREK